LSTQTTDYQQEMAGRLPLPFEVLSDAGFAFTNALKLPTFEAAGMRLIKRLTLIIRKKNRNRALSCISSKWERQSGSRLADAASPLRPVGRLWLAPAAMAKIRHSGMTFKTVIGDISCYELGK
jgi:hypothetical protein